MTRLVAALSLTIMALTLVGCSGGVLAKSRTDGHAVTRQNLDHNSAVIGVDQWTIGTSGPINVGAMNAERGIDSLGESPATTTHLAIGEARLAYANDQDSVLTDVRIELAGGDVVTIGSWESKGSPVVTAAVDRFRVYAERARALDDDAYATMRAYIETVEGPAAAALIDAVRALGTQGLSILPDLLGGAVLVESPVDPPDIAPDPE